MKKEIQGYILEKNVQGHIWTKVILGKGSRSYKENVLGHIRKTFKVILGKQGNFGKMF